MNAICTKIWPKHWDADKEKNQSIGEVSAVLFRAFWEEVAKFWGVYGGLYLMLRGNKTICTRKILLLAMAVGFGFQIFENFEYFVRFLGMKFRGDLGVSQFNEASILRSVICMHPVFTALCLRLVCGAHVTFSTAEFTVSKVLVSFLLPSTLHFAHNASLYFMTSDYAAVAKWLVDITAVGILAACGLGKKQDKEVERLTEDPLLVDCCGLAGWSGSIKWAETYTSGR
jgi:RsiW-degrading membrane proteinase PrsW (M82 family)